MVVESYVNLNIFIVATIMQTQTMSLIIQFFPENIHPTTIPIATNALIISRILIYMKFPNLKILCYKKRTLNKKIT